MSFNASHIRVAHPKHPKTLYACPRQPNHKDIERGELYRCGCCGHGGLLALEPGAECLCCGCVVQAENSRRQAA